MKTFIGFLILAGTTVIFYLTYLLIGVCTIFLINILDSGHLRYDLDTIHEVAPTGIWILVIIGVIILFSYGIGLIIF